jgi:O-antigen/teichoic acid export membrane protein
MPRLRALLHEKGARGMVVLLTIMYGLVVGCVIILLGARGIKIAYGVEVGVLWGHLALTSVFGIAQFLLVTLTAGLTAVREFKSVLYNSLALLFITSIVSFVFIPAGGLMGSILSNAIGAGSGALLAWIRLQKSLPATKSV